MWLYNLLINFENDFILHNFIIYLKDYYIIFFTLVYTLLFSINLIKIVKIHLKVF